MAGVIAEVDVRVGVGVGVEKLLFLTFSKKFGFFNIFEIPSKNNIYFQKFQKTKKR